MWNREYTLYPERDLPYRIELKLWPEGDGTGKADVTLFDDDQEVVTYSVGLEQPIMGFRSIAFMIPPDWSLPEIGDDTREGREWESLMRSMAKQERRRLDSSRDHDGFSAFRRLVSILVADVMRDPAGAASSGSYTIKPSARLTYGNRTAGESDKLAMEAELIPRSGSVGDPE